MVNNLLEMGLNKINNDTQNTIVTAICNSIPIAFYVEQVAAHLTCRDNHFPVGSCSGIPVLRAAGKSQFSNLKSQI